MWDRRRKIGAFGNHAAAGITVNGISLMEIQKNKKLLFIYSGVDIFKVNVLFNQYLLPANIQAVSVVPVFNYLLCRKCAFLLLVLNTLL